MQLPTSADELNDLIEIIDIPDFLRPALKERLQQPAYNNQHIDDEHLCHMIADHHATNWMTAKSARHYQLPRTSTRPGVPCSDVAFNIHFAIMLRAIGQAVLEEEARGQPIGGHEIEACSDPLFSSTPHDGSALRNVSFVDDLTDCNSTANASDLINTTTPAATRLCSAAFQHGLKPRPDKTKAILMHYGAGAKKEKQRVAKEGATYLELDGLSIKVQLVMQQKALGTIIAAGGVTGPEICLKVKRALGAARPLEKQILRRKKLSEKAKVNYVHSFSTSSVTCNHRLWGDLTQKDLKHIAAKCMGPCRVAASLPKTNSPVQHISEAEAIVKTGVPEFITHQTTARLRYLPRLLNHAPAVLLQFLDGERQRKGTWSRQLKKDFDFLRKYLPRERWPSQTQHDRDVINWARQKPKLFTNAVKAAVKAQIHHIRDQAQNAKLQKDIQMIPAVAPTDEFDHRDDTNNHKYVCYACCRVATRRGMAVQMGRDHPDHEDPRFWATGTACRCCQTEHHALPRLIKHLSVAHRCRKSWHAWHLQTLEPLTEQQIAENFNAIAEITDTSKKQGRHPTFSDKPVLPCDVTPLPLLETSPVVPKVLARLESWPGSPPASSPAGPAERQGVVFITDRPRQAADLQQIMANSGITCISGLDYTQIAIHNDGQPPEPMPELRRVHRRILHGEIAAIYVEFPRRTWCRHDASDFLGNRASRQRTLEAPWGLPEVSGTIADEIFAANNVAREVLRMLFAATTTHVPFVAAIAAESTCRQTPEYQHIANQTTVNETSTQHYDLGATQILDNGTRDDLRNRLTTANAEEIDFAIADLLGCNIVARWGVRTATAAPTSQNLNTIDAYYIEREDEVHVLMGYGAPSGGDIRKLTSFDRSDTDRTKMLKEVLKSAAKAAAAEEGDQLHAPTLRHASKALSDRSFLGSKKRSVSPRVSDMSQQPFLLEGEASQLQSSVMEDIEGEEGRPEDDSDGRADDLTPILRFSSSRIGGLCARLQTPELQVMPEVRSASRAPAGSEVSAAGPGGKGRRAARGQARSAERHPLRGRGGASRPGRRSAGRRGEAPVVERSRAEEAAAKFINDHSRFDQLEESSPSGSARTAATRTDLREAFPQRVHHHPALLALTDSLLADPAKFSQSIAQARRGEPLFVKASAPSVGARPARLRQHGGAERSPAPAAAAGTPAAAGGCGRPQTSAAGPRAWPGTRHAPRPGDVHRAASGIPGARRRFQGPHLTSQAPRSKTPSGTSERSRPASVAGGCPPLEQLGPVTPQAATRGRVFGSLSSTALLGGTL
ncbi:unnamed protein product [Prorocentrum cordatum]|uniref:Uncharacterized protein n=1 Tax=Prorocentrum cordatum TaxID=2364126 RepID=A0ABN9WJK6_9DINO|nr:unnamed protein product [Polarella glacialis]